jgi:hypothetical protein
MDKVMVEMFHLLTKIPVCFGMKRLSKHILSPSTVELGSRMWGISNVI